MERFYFNIFNDDITLDEEGVNCLDLEAAKERAIAEVRILASEAVRYFGTLDLTHRIEIVDETGQILAIVTFGDAIEIQA